MAKRLRRDGVLTLSPTTMTSVFSEDDLRAVDELHVHTAAISPVLQRQLRAWCRPTVLHLRLPWWFEDISVLWIVLDACGISVDELHVHSFVSLLLNILHRLPNLRHLHLSDDSASNQSFCVPLTRSPKFTDLTLHGHLFMDVYKDMSTITTLRTIHFPDVPDVFPDLDYEGWLADHVHAMPKLEPRLGALANAHKQARLEAVADVLPVVGVPELIIEMAFPLQYY
jgi:hypothetical protein